MTEHLRENVLLQRILETIIQIALIPMCIVGTWGYLTPGGPDAKDQYQPVSFLDAGYTRSGSYIATILIITCAVLAIVLCWTRVYGAVALPSIVQVFFAVRVYLYFTFLKRSDGGTIERYGYIFMILIIAGLIIAIWMRNAYVDEREVVESLPDEPEEQPETEE